MKICLTTYFDKNFYEMGGFCLKSMRKYAKKHGFEIKLFNGVSSERPAPWNKIIVIQNLLNHNKKYDFVLWIDSDAIFIRFDEDIRKEIEQGKDLYLVKHSSEEGLAPNTGVMLIRNSKWSRDFLEKVWNKKEYTYSIGWENAAVCDLLGFYTKKNKPIEFLQKILYKLHIKNQITGILKKIRINKSFGILNFSSSFEKKKHNPEFLKKVKWLGKKWNALPHYKIVKNAIVHHYPSISYEKRLEKMKEDIKRVDL